MWSGHETRLNAGRWIDYFSWEALVVYQVWAR